MRWPGGAAGLAGLAILLAAGGPAPGPRTAAAAQPGDAHNPCNRPNPCNPCSPNPCNAHGASAQPPEVEELIGEFMATGKDVADRPGGADAVQFPGPAAKPNWFQALVVTRDSNPMLEKQCKKDALALSVATLGEAEGATNESETLRAAAEHMRQHQRFIRENEISYSDYLKDIAECRSFCAPLVARLVRCHVLSVARRPHGIVQFALGSDHVEPAYVSGIITEVGRRLEERVDDKVLVIGRASKIGDLRYNRRLSAQRALAVRDALLARGISGDRIELMWFGWEPPQIGALVSREYGLAELYAREGSFRINQSVILVTYPGGSEWVPL